MDARQSCKSIHADAIDYCGKRVTLTCKCCSSASTDMPAVAAFLSVLADTIDRVHRGDQREKRFGYRIEEEELSSVQSITIRALVVQTSSAGRDLYLDVFSCKRFDENTIIDHVHQTFAPKRLFYKTLFGNASCGQAARYR